MKYTKMLMNMVTELRENGLQVSYMDNGAMVTNGTVNEHFYFETGSTINIYHDYQLKLGVKTQKSALAFIKKELSR